LCGASELPWVNVRIEDAEPVIRKLLRNGALRQAVGDYSRKWMERYWNERDMAQHYVKAYEDLLERPEIYDRFRFDPNSQLDLWRARGIHDAVWTARRDSVMPFLASFRKWGKHPLSNQID